MSRFGCHCPRRRLLAIGPRPLAGLGLAAWLLACGGGEQELGPTAKVERGRIERIHVDAGDQVEQGQPLVEIERELLASQVREAEAALRDARVELRFAKIDIGRSDELSRGGATSAQKHDTAQARYEGAQAKVARATAALDTLSTQLSY